MEVDSPDVVIAKRLFNHARLRGFTFQQTSALIIPGTAALFRRVVNSTSATFH